MNPNGLKWDRLKSIVEHNDLPLYVERRCDRKKFFIVAHSEIGALAWDEIDNPTAIKFHDKPDFGKMDVVPRPGQSLIYSSCLKKAGFRYRPISREQIYNQISYRCRVCGLWHLTKVGAFK